MDNELYERLKLISIEDVILGIFILLVVLSFIANKIERNALVNNDLEDVEKYYYLQIFIFGVVVIINIYFIFNSYSEIMKLKEKDSPSKKKYAYLSFVAGLAALLAGGILLYIAIIDKDLEAEMIL